MTRVGRVVEGWKVELLFLYRGGPNHFGDITPSTSVHGGCHPDRLPEDEEVFQVEVERTMYGGYLGISQEDRPLVVGTTGERHRDGVTIFHLEDWWSEGRSGRRNERESEVPEKGREYGRHKKLDQRRKERGEVV